MHRLVIYFLPFFLLYCSACQPPESSAEQSAQQTPYHAPPNWAKEAVWYQIFVERFYNGDPSNDPTPSDMQGAYPGEIPENWSVTPWTHDWYAEDNYMKDAVAGARYGGDTLRTFGQKSQLRRYGGDLQGVLDKIDYLDSLGITAVYFNPLNDAPSLHKYDARHWRHIDRNFGPNPQKDAVTIAKEVPNDPTTWQFTEADKLFIQVIEALHQRGIRVILDYSWNHTGRTFWAWNNVLQQQDSSPYAMWYWVEQFDEAATPENEFRYRGWFGVPDMPEIRETVYNDHAEGIQPFEGNLLDSTAKEHIFTVTRRWLDPNGDGDPSDGVDGYRLDVAVELPLDFWREYRNVVRSVNPDAFLLGEIWFESWPDKLLNPAPFLQGDMFDAPMNYRWYRAARHFFNAAPDSIPAAVFIDSLKAFQNDVSEANHYAMMNLVSSHDAPRVLTSLFNKNLYKLNSKPETDATYKIHRPDAATFQTLRLLIAHQFTYIGAPHIWAGDEMGMWGADDPNCRKPLIWQEYTFEPETTHPLGLPRPTDSVAFNQELFSFYQRLIQLRKDNPVLVHGDIRFIELEEAQEVLAYSRYKNGMEAIVVFNIGNEDKVLHLPTREPTEYQMAIGVGDFIATENSISGTLPARSFAILFSAKN